jgi:hypothetical protein
MSYQSAHAAFVQWGGDPNGSTDKLYWENGGSDFGLFGDPTISGNTFSFSPQNFIAISTNSIPADTCDTLVFDLIAKPGYSITQIRVSEGGLYDIADGEVLVSGQFTIENLLTNEILSDSLDLSPDMPVTSGADTWTATAAISGFNWTHIRLSLYNDLFAYSDSAALVDKKTAGTPLIQIIPEPATICVLGFGALSLIRRKNNKIILTNGKRRTVMKKLITICLVCILTTVASGNVIIDFNENGVGHIDGTTSLVWGTGIPLLAGQNDQYATLYYELPNIVVEGDLALYESEFDISDVLRFVNEQGSTGGLTGRVYVYSDLPEREELPELADTGIPYDFLSLSIGMDEQGTENGWNGVDYTPYYVLGQDLYTPGFMAQYGNYGVTYNFTSDIPEPATICLLGLGTLSLIRRKNNK